MKINKKLYLSIILLANLLQAEEETLTNNHLNDIKVFVMNINQLNNNAFEDIKQSKPNTFRWINSVSFLKENLLSKEEESKLDKHIKKAIDINKEGNNKSIFKDFEKQGELIYISSNVQDINYYSIKEVRMKNGVIVKASKLFKEKDVHNFYCSSKQTTYTNKLGVFICLDKINFQLEKPKIIEYNTIKEINTYS